MKTLLSGLAAGSGVSLVLIGAAWLVIRLDWVATSNWRLLAALLLGAAAVFALFVPANKGGQQFGPHGSGGQSPFVSAGAEFADTDRRVRSSCWLTMTLPLTVAAMVVLLWL